MIETNTIKPMGNPEYSFGGQHRSNVGLESNLYSMSLDLICEGPIEGLVDQEGSVLKYIKDNSKSDVVLGKGIYYNNMSLMDQKTNLLNYVTQGFSIQYGSGDNISLMKPSTVFMYNMGLPLSNSSTGIIGDFIVGGKSFIVEGGQASDEITEQRVITSQTVTNADAGTWENILTSIRRGKKLSIPFVHRVANNYADTIIVNIVIDQMFKQDNDVEPYRVSMAIELSESNSSKLSYFAFQARGIVKGGGYVLPIKIKTDFNPFVPNNYVLKLIPLSVKVSPTEGKRVRQIGVHSVEEQVVNRGIFNYPYSVVVTSSASSKHFKSDPQRTFDLKLLKIKIPNNYDPEAKEYSGIWSGDFDKFTKWTDNPAWIYYDLCTNHRYGVGNGNILSEDLNKWELYKIGKYCDELVESISPRGAKQDTFTYYPNFGLSNYLFVGKNPIAGLSDLQDVYDKYSAVKLSDQATEFGVESNLKDPSDCLIFLFNINENYYPNSKKIILEIEEGFLKKVVTGDDEETAIHTMEFVPADSAGQGAVFRFKVINDFGPTSFYEKNNVLLRNFSDTIGNRVDYDNDKLHEGSNLDSLISKSVLNTDKHAKDYALRDIASSIEESIRVNYLNPPAFSEINYEKVPLVGSCLPRVEGYRDPLEPRFTANVLIDNETEVLKLLNDMASIFRGITYYRNNLITTTIDVRKPISHIFNNTNVKDSLFTYSTGSIDGNYSVAKVFFKDKFNKFREEVEVVEDSELIKDYGIVTKEILGFGVTSRDQARRMGLWMLATNRFENQTVTFTTDIQGLLLKPGDIIQIQDSYKTTRNLQGRVLSFNSDDNSIIIDRNIDSDLAGAAIKFLYDVQKKDVSSVNSSEEYKETEITSVFEMIISSVRSNGNKIILTANSEDSEETENTEFLNNFSKISESTPFIISEDNSSGQEYFDSNTVESNSDNENLYKIVSIAEEDVNEYSIFAIKYDLNKYTQLDNNIIKANVSETKGLFMYSSSQNITEIDLTGMVDSEGRLTYYALNSFPLEEINNIDFDHTFSEEESFLNLNRFGSYGTVEIDFTKIKKYIDDKSDEGVSYFQKITDLFDQGGGFLCKVIHNNQSITFKVSLEEISIVRIFAGKIPSELADSFLSSVSKIKIYVYDVNDKIIEV